MRHWISLLVNGINPHRYDFRHMKANFSLLRRLENDHIASEKDGRLVQKKRHLAYGTKRLKASLEALFISFLYEIRAPLNKEAMAKHFHAKYKIAHEARQKLQRNSCISTQGIDEEIARFKRHFFWRQQIVKQATASVQKSTFVQEIKEALDRGITPTPVLKGFSGTWVLRDNNYCKAAIFKPFDEEMGAPNNPSKEDLRAPLGSFACRKGIASGEAFINERRVYQISRRLGLDVVPQTEIALFKSHFFPSARRTLTCQPAEKIGSLQHYIKNAVTFGELPERFIHAIAPQRLQAIFILDMIVGHDDRHGHNLLWDGYKAWAIDNGFSLSARTIPSTGWKWVHMPQARLRLDKELEHKILASDPDILVKELNADEACRVKERLAVIKCALAEGLSPYNIVEIMTISRMKSLAGLERTLYERAQNMVAAFKHELERLSFWPTL